MRNKTALLKKSFALLLTVVFVFSAANFTVIATGEEQPVSKTAGELTAVNYESLTDGEKAILTSDLVIGNTYTYHVPTAGDGIVTVNADNKTVTAAAVVKDGYTWTPVSAVVVHDNGSENVTLSCSGDNYTGAFAYDGNSYRVDVTYSRTIQVDTVVQSKLLNGPYYLSRGLDNINDLSMYVFEISDVMDTVNNNLTNSNVCSSPLSQSDPAAAAIRELLEQIENNGVVDVDSILSECYSDNGNDVLKTRFLFERGAELKETAKNTYDYLYTICNSDNVDSALNSIEDKKIKRKIRNALSTLSDIVTDWKDAVEDNWDILQSANNPFKSGLSNADYQLLDTLAAGLMSAEYHNDKIKAELNAFADISNVINRHSVVVSVNANIIPKTVLDSAETLSLDPYVRTVLADDGADPEAIVAAIQASGVEAAALESWNDVDSVHYTRTADTVSSPLTDDITYTISYTPKTYGITYDFTTDLPVSVPYGYNMTLPRHGGDEVVYDYYTVGGTHYFEGDSIKITGNTEISRTENKPWSVLKQAQIIEEVYSGALSDEEKEILQSSALISDDVTVRVPAGNDDIVHIELTGENSFEITADNYPSDIQDLVWTPVEGYAVSYDGVSVSDAFVFTNNTATFTFPDFGSVRVRYELYAGETLISNAEALEILNLPKTLADEAKDQKANMKTLDDLYDNLKEFDSSTLNQIRIAVKGGDMSQNAIDAVENIIETCVNTENDSLYLYEYLTGYRQDGLAYYYRDGNYSKIAEQIRVLNENLSTVYQDEGFLPLLDSVDYEEYYDMIGDIINSLSAVTISKPNAAIDTESPSLSNFVASINGLIDNTHTFVAADRDIKLNAVYESEIFKITFKADGTDVAVIIHTNAASITEPDVPVKSGYVGNWEKYMLKSADEITVNAEYVRGTVNIGMSISLEDEILINCYVFNLKLPEGASYEDCKAVYTFNGNTAEQTLTAANMLSDTLQENKIVIARCAAKEITDTVTVTVYYNNFVIKEFEYSIKQYCDDTVNNPKADTDVKELCLYVLDYGTDAQIRFGYKTDALANGGNYQSATTTISEEYNKAEKTGSSMTIGASLTLEYKTEINIYFITEVGYKSVIVYDGADIYSNVSEVLYLGNNLYRIVISGIAAKDLDKEFTVVIEDTNDNVCTFKYSALSYLYKRQDNADEGQVCKSLFKYFQLADSFFGN